MMTLTRLIKPPILLLMALELMGVSSCAHSQVPRPDTPLCIINVPGLHEKCYNLKTDYDDNGQLLPGAKAIFIKYKDAADMLAGLNKKTSTTDDGLAHLKAYIKDVREEGRSGD